MPLRKAVAYIHPGAASFIAKDLQMLGRHAQVLEYAFAAAPSFTLPLEFIRQTIWLIFKTLKADIWICMFVGWHSVLPVLLGRVAGKRVWLIAGGADSNCLPEVGYGNFRKPLLAMATRFCYRYCSLIVPVHEALARATNTYVANGPLPQGFLHFCPGLATQVQPIYNGYDADAFPYGAAIRPQRSFITIAASLQNPVRMAIKGIDLVIAAAQALPDCTFTIVGAPFRPAGLPSNITTLPFTTPKLLPGILGQHLFYLQLSMTEGFPNAIAEAMLCGCVPIASTVSALPDIVGNTGFLVPKQDLATLLAKLDEALGADWQSLSLAARERIATNYTMERREAAFVKLLGEQ